MHATSRLDDSRSIHVESSHGCILSREADLVPCFQRLNVANPATAEQNHSLLNPEQNILPGHSPIRPEQSSYSSDRGVGCHVTRHLLPAQFPSSPTKATDYRRDGIDVRSVTKDFKSKIKSRGWSRASVSTESSAKHLRLHNFNTSTEKAKTRSKILTLSLLDCSNSPQQDSGFLSFARHPSAGKQAEFEALTLGPGCPWADSVDSFL